MQKQLNAVKLFHTTYGLGVSEEMKADLGTQKNNLRFELMKEENEEYLEAVQNNDLVEIADALCDLQYVLSGAVLEFGLGNKFVELFNEVQRSNMSKTCDTEEQAQETVEFYTSRGEEAYYEKSGDKYNVHRVSDNKVLKNKYYSSANLKSILEK